MRLGVGPPAVALKPVSKPHQSQISIPDSFASGVCRHPHKHPVSDMDRVALALTNLHTYPHSKRKPHKPPHVDVHPFEFFILHTVPVPYAKLHHDHMGLIHVYGYALNYPFSYTFDLADPDMHTHTHANPFGFAYNLTHLDTNTDAHA